MRSFLRSLLLLTGATLQACYLLQAAPESPAAQADPAPDLAPVITAFVQCFNRQPLAACEQSVVFPFYIDGQAQTQAEFMAELPRDRQAPLPAFTLQYRLLPLADMAFYWPESWQHLQRQPGFEQFSEALWLMPVSLRSDSLRSELFWLLVRQTPAGWRIVGFHDD